MVVFTIDYYILLALEQENDGKSITTRSLLSRMSDHAGLMRLEMALYDAFAYSMPSECFSLLVLASSQSFSSVS